MKIKIYILLIFILSCGSNSTKQNLNISYKLSTGMTKSEVEKIMGPPIRSDFSKNVDEWFYCNTGGSDFSNPYPVDEHLVLFFYNNKLITKKNYTVTVKDTGGIYGSCEKFIKMGNYSVPDEVLEIRIKY